MSNYNSLTFIKRIVRSLLKDRLQTDGRMSYNYQGINIFTLPDDYPSSSTITVYRNGLILTSGWTYNSSNNTVTITSPLTTNDIILITYHYYDKFSDNEIVDYIEASLSLFATYNYSKLFTLNTNRDAIVTLNDTNPNLKECYQICVITAINIDPNNIDIKTKEFSITATENKSKSDLLAETFQKFTGSFLGEFEWSEILEEDK